MTEVLQSSSSLSCLLFLYARGDGRADEIAELFGLDLMEVSATLVKLEHEYILNVRQVHQTLHYSMSPSWSYMTELKSMLQKIIDCMPYEDQQMLMLDQGFQRAAVSE